MNNVLLEINDSIAVLTLNRPERRNALSLDLMREMLSHLQTIGANREVKAVILKAAGTVFCSGHDLGEMTGRTLGEYQEIFDVCTQMMERIQALPQPVIAEVQGVATAAGCQLVCTCDLAIASDKAGFATPGVRIGLFCTTPMVALTRSVGRKRAMEMLLTGRMISATQAADWGIVNRAVAARDLANETMMLAREIAAASSLVVDLGKNAFYRQIEIGQQKAYETAKDIMSMNALAGDAQEGISAFLEKRKPCWKGQ